MGNKLHCGKFLPSQLNREIATANIKSQSRFSWFLGLTSLFFANSALAQEVKPSTEIVENKNSLDRQDSAQWIEIKGTVSDEYGPMGGVVVMEKGTKNVVPADDYGDFSIKIPVNKFQNPVFLVFNSFGYEAQEFEIFKDTKNRNCRFDAESSSYLSGKVGGIMVVEYKHPFIRKMTRPFRTLWRKMSNSH